MGDHALQKLIDDTVAFITLDMEDHRTGEKLIAIEAIDRRAADALFQGLKDIEGITVSGSELKHHSRKNLIAGDPIDDALAALFAANDPVMISLNITAHPAGRAEALLGILDKRYAIEQSLTD